MFNTDNLPSKQPSELVAVVVPMSKRKELTEEEKISLRHLNHYLGKYDKFLIIPESMTFDIPGFGIKRVSNKFFGSAKKHDRLLRSSKFYKTFIDYKFLLIYHLDALVFSDQLSEWCERDFDYIGAPLSKLLDSPEVSFSGVGNGGFSLRRIAGFLRLLSSPKHQYLKLAYWFWEIYLTLNPLHSRIWPFFKRYLKGTKIYENTRKPASLFACNEDRFLADTATKCDPDFKIAPVDIALRFAFECAPRYCFEKNNNTLPFGCHAWNRYDRDFWEPYLLK